MSTSCVGCKFLYGDGDGYSNYTWMETWVHCALDFNKELRNDHDIPHNLAKTKPEDDKWPPTASGRCECYSPGVFIVLDPDREDHPSEVSQDQGQIEAICRADGLPLTKS